MADFRLIHEHPWWTLFAIAGGGFILYLIIHRRSSSTADTTGQVSYAGTTPQVDPNIAAQLEAQSLQAQASLSGLTIQGNTQIALARIGAGVQSQQVGAEQDVTNQQTAAQLQLGLGTLDSQVQMAQISADVQSKTIDAIMYAFGAYHPVTNPTPYQPYTPPTSNNPAPAPINTYSPPDVVPLYPVSGNPSTTTQPSYWWNQPVDNPGMVVHGVTEESCSSLPFADQAACVARNQSRVDASYAQFPGSYLGGNQYAP